MSSISKSKIRRLREKKRLSIANLSYEVRINPAIISYGELRKLVISPTARETLSAYYGLPINALFDSKTGMAR